MPATDIGVNTTQWPIIAMGWVWFNYKGTTLIPVGGAKKDIVNPKYNGAPFGFTDQSNIATCNYTAKYQVISVRYAPPGTGLNLTPYVKFETTSGNSITTGISNTNTNSASLSASAKLSSPGGSGEITTTMTTTQSNSTSLTQTIAYEGSSSETHSPITYNKNGDATGEDGINHDFDVIRILANPLVTIVGSPTDRPIWLAQTGKIVNGQVVLGKPVYDFISVKDIKDRTSKVHNNFVKKYGFTDDDFKELLKVDPFAKPGPYYGSSDYKAYVTKPKEGSADTTNIIDTNRFEYLGSDSDYPYLQSIGTKNQTCIWTQVSSKSKEATLSYEVSVTASVTAGNPDLGYSVTVSAGASHSWEQSTSLEKTSSTAYKIEAELCPQKGKKYGTVYLYLDKVYKTFLFSFTPPSK